MHLVPFHREANCGRKLGQEGRALLLSTQSWVMVCFGCPGLLGSPAQLSCYVACAKESLQDSGCPLPSPAPVTCLMRTPDSRIWHVPQLIPVFRAQEHRCLVLEP